MPNLGSRRHIWTKGAWEISDPAPVFWQETITKTSVIPAEAGIQPGFWRACRADLDPGVRRGDGGVPWTEHPPTALRLKRGINAPASIMAIAGTAMPSDVVANRDRGRRPESCASGTCLGLQAIPGVEVVSVCNRRRESAEAFAAEFDIPRVVDPLASGRGRPGDRRGLDRHHALHARAHLHRRARRRQACVSVRRAWRATWPRRGPWWPPPTGIPTWWRRFALRPTAWPVEVTMRAPAAPGARGRRSPAGATHHACRQPDRRRAGAALAPGHRAGAATTCSPSASSPRSCTAGSAAPVELQARTDPLHPPAAQIPPRASSWPCRFPILSA